MKPDLDCRNYCFVNGLRLIALNSNVTKYSGDSYDPRKLLPPSKRGVWGATYQIP